MSVPAYTAEELATRIADGSIDLNRLAATVSGLLELETTVTALAQWVNARIAAEDPVDPKSRGKR